MKLTRLTPVLGLLVGLLLTAGCGDDGPVLHKVSGTVVFMDGTPVTEGSVTFINSKGESAIGKINEKGEFVLTTTEEGDGAPAGSYKVSVSEPGKEATDPGEPTTPTGKDPIPQEDPDKKIFDDKYTDPDKSGIVKVVKAGENKFEIKVGKAK